MSYLSRFERMNGIVNAEWIRTLRAPVGIVLVALLTRPVLGNEFVLGSPHIATTILIWMLFAASFNLLFGYVGLLSFGHAMFLGTGVYVTAIGLSEFGLPFSLMTLLAVVVSSALAYVIGRIIVRYGEIYFAMLTLAFAMGVHFVVNANPYDLTGGSDGIRSGTTPEWISSFRGRRLIDVGWVDGLFASVGLEPSYYWFVALVFAATMLLLWQIVRSPFGRTLVAIRDNEELARAMGISVDRYKVWTLTMSAGFSAVAGALLMINNYGASLRNFGPQTSAEVLLMTIFGGVHFFFGPVVGAFSWFGIREYLQTFEVLSLPLVGAFEAGTVLSYWRFFFGFAFVLVIVLAPSRGLWGLVRGYAADAIAAVRRRFADE
ncbi:branched-chain amino acid ABC transporter permease [Halostella litorea]|uniref:branched-chain amino acid ABC transporter permease n=1 Tax=Halostella litorea TaxID=2528831 RepID=UPI001092801B|nr:branched-chain amino acid ABC transporter permease [Halostella litorea]